MRLSIRWRLAVIIAAAMVVTLLAILIVMRITLENTLRSDLDSDLTGDYEQVQAQVIAISGPFDQAALRDIANDHGGTSSGSAFVIFRETDGSFSAVTGNLEPEPYDLTPDEVPRVLDGEVLHETVTTGGVDTRVRTSRLMDRGQPIGIVQVATDAEFINDVVSDVQQVLVVVGIIGIAFAIIIGYWLARGAVRPLEHVAAVAAQIEAEGLDRRIRARNVPAEIQRLSDTFDAMLDRIEKAFGQQRDFVLDMSHELRTPLAALRGNIDVMLLDETIDAETRDQLERMSREVQRLVRLATNLLFSAHAEAGREVERRPVDLDVLVLEVCRQAKTLRPEVKVRIADEDQVTVNGDYDLLKQLVLNLLDNALKYSPAGGEVTVSISGDQREARVVVADQGPGIAADQLPHIFERMYRAEDGKRRTTGAGLGLSISDWIARAHAGRIVVESVAGKGSTFTLVLPREEAAASPATAT